MTTCATVYVKDMYSKNKISGIISVGGSGGTTLAAAVMREAIPIGFPKVMVSSKASGDTRPLVGETDITMLYSVVDIADSNALLDGIFFKAEKWLSNYRGTLQDGETRITMFGVTTRCVEKIQEMLGSRNDFEVYVFHATGYGGRAMERLIEEDRLDAVLGITTTESAIIYTAAI